MKPKYPNKEGDENVPHPINGLNRGIKNIQKLHEAHATIIEDPKVFKEWVEDQPSIYINSGITLLCACWEGFVEDCAEFALEFLVLNATEPSQIPLNLRKKVAKEIKSDKNELSPWDLANDGWREILSSRFNSIMKSRVAQMNSPKPTQINDLYSDLLGIEDLSISWTWGNFSDVLVREQVESFVKARGAIAHGRKPDIELGSYALTFFTNLILECSYRTSNEVRGFIEKNLNLEIWPELSTKLSWETYDECEKLLPSLEHVMVFRKSPTDAYHITAQKIKE